MDTLIEQLIQNYYFKLILIFGTSFFLKKIRGSYYNDGMKYQIQYKTNQNNIHGVYKKLKEKRENPQDTVRVI